MTVTDAEILARVWTAPHIEVRRPCDACGKPFTDCQWKWQQTCCGYDRHSFCPCPSSACEGAAR